MFFIHERMWQKLEWGKSSGVFIQMTGMSGSGKSTLASSVASSLSRKGYCVEVIDGDEYRTGLCSDLGFSKEDRNTNIRRLGFVSKVLARNNVISIIAAINPYENIRQEISLMSDKVRTVYIECDLKILKKRDTKGLYKRAQLPDDHPDKVYNFTGISDPYEVPAFPDLVVNTEKENIDQSIIKLEDFIIKSVS
jgi:adenylylsulfate kinase